MGIFNKLFGKQETQNENEIAEQEFDADWKIAQSRFVVITGIKATNFKLKHPQTGEEMLPHEGLGGTFSDWQQIQSQYDKRALLFNQLYDVFGNAMNSWQTANYLVLDRRADVALQVLEESEKPSIENADYAEHCASYSKAFINLGRYKEALN